MARVCTVNMIPGGVSRVINVSQYDNDYTVAVTLLEGQNDYSIPADSTIRVEGTKPDGLGFEYDCTYASNVVQMPIKTQMSVVAGQFPIELVVYKDGIRVGSANMVLAVEKAPLGEGTDISETVLPDIIDAAEANADRAEEAADRAEEIVSHIGDMAPAIIAMASGDNISFSDGTNNPVIAATADIALTQAGSGIPSPTNVRTITGYNSIAVVVSPTMKAADGKTYSITFPSTVYSGSINLITGVLTVDKQGFILDGSEAWTYDGTLFQQGTKRGTISYPDSAICDTYKNVTSYAAMTSTDNSISTTTTVIRIHDSRFTTVEALKAELAARPVTYVVPLAAPLTYQLTPVEIETLQGLNYIFANTGAVTLNYYADTKAYIGETNAISDWHNGSLNSSGVETSAANRIVSDFVSLEDSYLTVKTNGQRAAFCLYTGEKTFLINSGWCYADFILKPFKTAKFVRFVVAELNDAALSPTDLRGTFERTEGLLSQTAEIKPLAKGFTSTPFSQTVEVILHRGYSRIAPENTIPAFKLAREMGFNIIEADLQLTSDGVPVVLHDGTVNRTSNGTGNIFNMTLAQAKELDFGSWKSSMWAGTKIPTFEELLDCCKKIGLNIYIEIKAESPWNQSSISSCVEMVRKYGMKDNVSWISTSSAVLGYVKTAESTAMLGLINSSFTTGNVDTCVGLKTSSNQVIAVANRENLTSTVIDYMVSNDVPLCAYLYDQETHIVSMPSYVSKAITNDLNVAKYLYEKNIEL